MTLDFYISCWSGFLLIVQRRSPACAQCYGPHMVFRLYTTTSTTLLQRFIGYEYLKGSTLKSLWWLFVCCMSARSGPVIPWSTGSCRRSVWSSTSTLVNITVASTPHTALQLLAGRRSFLVVASIIWNSLPLEVQSSDWISAFRRRLKTRLF